MKSKYLFPTWSSPIGYLLAIPGFVLGYLSVIHEYKIPGFGFHMREKDSGFLPAFENFTNELAVFLVVAGLILIAFSKNKKEDELNAKLRLNALYWAVMTHYIFLFSSMIWSRFVGEIPVIGQHIFEITVFLPLVILITRYAYLRIANKESYLVGHPRFLPYQPYRIIGVILSIVALSVFIYSTLFNGNWSFDVESLAYAASILGLSIWAFSKRRIEDEMIMQDRLESLLLAVYINYVVLLVATLAFYSLAYLFVLAYSTLSLLLFFIMRMEYINYKNKKFLSIEGGLSHEK